jgi:hypothetical protein
MNKFSLLTLFFLANSATSAELERGNITSCAYQAGTAFEIQKIRQTETDNWEEFEKNIKQIYKDTQGRQDLLNIAERVFIQPMVKSPDDVHEIIFNACVQRQQGTEPKV